MALVLLMRCFNRFNRLSISAPKLHVILLKVINCVKHAVYAEDDRTDIVIQGLVEISLCVCFQCSEHNNEQCTNLFHEFSNSGNLTGYFQQYDYQDLYPIN